MTPRRHRGSIRGSGGRRSARGDRAGPGGRADRHHHGHVQIPRDHERRVRGVPRGGVTYEITVSYWFSFGRDFYDFVWTACAKNTLYKDGLGLPGSHSCGLPRISRTAGYLG